MRAQTSSGLTEPVVQTLDRYTKAAKRGLIPRLSAGAVTAAIIGLNGNAHAAGAWFAAIFLFEFVVSPKFARYVIEPAVVNRPESVVMLLAWRIGGGAALYATGWVGVWITGGQVGAFIGINWFCGALAYALVYFSSHRTIFLAGAIPPILCGLVTPLVMGGFRFETFAMEVIAVQTILIILTGARDRTALLGDLVKSEAQRVTAEEANRSKSHFIATMSHELRTPLNAVIGYSEMLEEELSEKGEIDAAADATRIHRAAKHLLGLINDVLDTSKIEAGKAELHVETIDMRGMIEDAVETLRPLAKANGNTLVTRVAADIGAVGTDATKYRQCLLNLVSNAVKFTRGGEVRVTAFAEQKDGERYIVARVSDTGIGISPEQAERLFQPFMQVDGALTRQHQGTGLGLYICRKLANLMGGDVTLESALGKGTTFTLRVRSLAISAPASEQRAA